MRTVSATFFERNVLIPHYDYKGTKLFVSAMSVISG